MHFVSVSAKEFLRHDRLIALKVLLNPNQASEKTVVYFMSNVYRYEAFKLKTDCWLRRAYCL